MNEWWIVFCKSTEKSASVTQSIECTTQQRMSNQQDFPELYWLVAGHAAGTDDGCGFDFLKAVRRLAIWSRSKFWSSVYVLSVQQKCELSLYKRQPNVAFCASDISCIRKMALPFQIYDTPYWTEASSLTHPSIQPPESASNAHHGLMNVINLCAGSRWTRSKQNIL